MRDRVRRRPGDRAMLTFALVVGVHALLFTGVIARNAGLGRFGPGWYLVGSTVIAFGLIGLATVLIVPSRRSTDPDT